MDSNRMKNKIAGLQREAETWTPERIFEWAFGTFGDKAAISSAFGAEGMVLIDIASTLSRGFRVFTLDTEFLFPETHNLMDRVEQKYGIAIEKVYPLVSPEEQERIHGPALWSRDPDACCAVRKIEPLRRKLSELQAWITGIRRDQTPARAGASKIEWDEKFNLVKINPISDWTSDHVWQYIRTRDVPYNPLHDRGYPSIGCTHCTRAVSRDEDTRAGRWAGFEKTECGLHLIQPAQNSTEA
jgi:phosphoadenosine phosphosulfate reductase